MRPAGLEPAACWFEASRSIQLSYGRNLNFGTRPIVQIYRIQIKNVPDWGRTSNLILRRDTLYPVELRAQIFYLNAFSISLPNSCIFLAAFLLSFFQISAALSVALSIRL